jgi:hypothetical protein
MLYQRKSVSRAVRNWAAVLLVIAASTAASAQVNAVRDLGCRVNDPSFDNGPVLNAAFAKFGKELNEEIYLPGGAYYCETPLVLPDKTGMSLRGNGITIALNENAYHDLTGGPASRLVYTGPAELPAITYRGMGLKLDGITLQRGAFAHPPVPPRRDGSIGIEIAGDTGPPTGKLYAPQLAIIGFDTAIYISPLPQEQHADNNLFGYLSVQHCRTVFRSDNQQSVGNQFQTLLVGGWCETVFDIRRGGDLVVNFLMLNNAALVLKLGDVPTNTGSYEIRSMKVDNNAAGWRLVQMDKPRPVRLHVGGHIGLRAMPAADAIVLRGDPALQDVRIDLWHEGRKWPQ